MKELSADIWGVLLTGTDKYVGVSAADTVAAVVQTDDPVVLF